MGTERCEICGCSHSRPLFPLLLCIFSLSCFHTTATGWHHKYTQYQYRKALNVEALVRLTSVVRRNGTGRFFFEGVSTSPYTVIGLSLILSFGTIVGTTIVNPFALDSRRFSSHPCARIAVAFAVSTLSGNSFSHTQCRCTIYEATNPAGVLLLTRVTYTNVS